MKYTNINIDKCSKDDLINEIDRLKSLYNNYNGFQSAQKEILNSFYGIFGNPYFIFYNKDIAESITTQCRDLNFGFIVKKINEYFKNDWHEDYDIHNKLNINVDSEIDDDVIIYGATDSNFLDFNKIIESTNFEGKRINFILDLYKYKLKDFINDSFKEYAKTYKTENLQNLKLETIFNTLVLIKKNVYFGSSIWKEPNITLDPKKNIIYKGLDIIKKTTPYFMRKKLDYLMNYIITTNKTIDFQSLVEKIKTVKEEFLLERIENISISSDISDYDRYVLNDRDDIQIKKNTPVPIRGASIYNYLLNQNEIYKKKYFLIKTGDKIKYYLTKDKDINVFSFLNGNFPIEINPPEYDYEQMFSKTFLKPLNQILNLIYETEVPDNLVSLKNQSF